MAGNTNYAIEPFIKFANGEENPSAESAVKLQENSKVSTIPVSEKAKPVSNAPVKNSESSSNVWIFVVIAVILLTAGTITAFVLIKNNKIKQQP